MTAAPLYQSGHFAFETGAATDTGCVRDHNEDSHFAHPAFGLWLVADGMGGHDAGDFASQTIVAEMESLGVPGSASDLQARFHERLDRAHRRILAHSQSLGGVTVGATMVALVIFEEGYVCHWSGDSRIYLLRDRMLRQLTHDHTEVYELLRRGMITAAQAAVWPRRNVITRAIGVSPHPECDMVHGNVMVGDMFLLCSDGLTEHNTDQDLAAFLASGEPVQVICDRLIAQTVARGAKDNVTAMVLRCHEPAPPVPDED
ncbi:MAG: serine/threonine-protein phosphatase [Rubellimicrobium sp.]|nr:serine/threonine-protein phosphatase [Rubellimicrobium sp.]